MDMHVQIAAEIFRCLSPGPHKFGGYAFQPTPGCCLLKLAKILLTNSQMDAALFGLVTLSYIFSSTLISLCTCSYVYSYILIFVQYINKRLGDYTLLVKMHDF